MSKNQEINETTCQYCMYSRVVGNEYFCNHDEYDDSDEDFDCDKCKYFCNKKFSCFYCDHAITLWNWVSIPQRCDEEIEAFVEMCSNFVNMDRTASFCTNHESEKYGEIVFRDVTCEFQSNKIKNIKNDLSATGG